MARTHGRNIHGAPRPLPEDAYRLEVLATHRLTSGYTRVRLDVDGLFQDYPSHAAQWARLWLPVTPAPDGAAPGTVVEQRGYTLINADPSARGGRGTADIEFALHEGLAARWALDCSPGDTIGCSPKGSRDIVPADREGVAEWLMVGDGASLPAIGEILRRRPIRPDGTVTRARVLLESQHDDDPAIPLSFAPGAAASVEPGHRELAPGDSVTWIPRGGAGRGGARHRRRRAGLGHRGGRRGAPLRVPQLRYAPHPGAARARGGGVRPLPPRGLLPARVLVVPGRVAAGPLGTSPVSAPPTGRHCGSTGRPPAAPRHRAGG